MDNIAPVPIASPNSNTHTTKKHPSSNSNVVYGVTRSDSVKGSLSWRVLRFKDLDKRTGEYVESPEFSVGNYKWSLFLYPNGSKDDAKNYISIFLSCLNIYQEVTINFTVTFIARQEGGDKILGPIKKTFGEDELDWGWSKALDHRTLELWYLSGTSGDQSSLFIKCDVEVFGEWTTTLDNNNHEEELPKILVPNCGLVDDFEKLLVEHPHSDVKFMVGDQQLLAHKGILSVRSAVFRGMFANGMREVREGLVYVEDIEYDIFKAALKFIYTGKCDTKLMEDKPLELLMVADKYDLPRLKCICEEVILRKLDVKSCTSSLLQADMYHAVNLKKQVLEFITNHFFEVIAADGFKEWSVDNPVLITEIHDAMAVKMGTKAANIESESSQSKSKKNNPQKRRRNV